MTQSITDIVRSEFKKGTEVTLEQLYHILSQNPKIQKLEPNKQKHRVRSTIYSLKKSNDIIQVGKATYKKA